MKVILLSLWHLDTLKDIFSSRKRLVDKQDTSRLIEGGLSHLAHLASQQLLNKLSLTAAQEVGINIHASHLPQYFLFQKSLSDRFQAREPPSALQVHEPPSTTFFFLDLKIRRPVRRSSTQYHLL